MKKVFFTVVVVSLLLFGGVIFYGLMSINPLIKKAVEYMGPEMTGAPVTLAESDVSIFSGEGALRGLFVGNPKGFETPSAIELDAVSIKVDTTSFSTGKIIINELVIDTPRITYERSGKISNFDALMANVKKAVGQEGDAKGERDKQAESGAGEGEPGGSQKIVIENCWIKNGSVKLAVTGMGGELATVSLPDIHLTDIGAEGDGATPAEALEEILGAITKGSTKAVGSVAAGVSEQLQKGADALKKGADSLKKNLEGGLQQMFGQ